MMLSNLQPNAPTPIPRHPAPNSVLRHPPPNANMVTRHPASNPPRYPVPKPVNAFTSATSILKQRPRHSFQPARSHVRPNILKYGPLATRPMDPARQLQRNKELAEQRHRDQIAFVNNSRTVLSQRSQRPGKMGLWLVWEVLYIYFGNLQKNTIKKCRIVLMFTWQFIH